MATLTSRKVVEGGLAGSLSGCATGGDEFINSGVEFLHIVNDHASTSYTISITAQTTSVRHPNYGVLTKANQTVTVAAGTQAFMGPFRQQPFPDQMPRGRQGIMSDLMDMNPNMTGFQMFAQPAAATIDPSDYRTILKMIEQGLDPEDYMNRGGIASLLQ